MKEQAAPEDVKGLVFDIRRFSTHDGPGLRTTVFTKGCPLRCKWCQNPEGLDLKKRLWYFKNKCIGCGICISVCPKKALRFSEQRSVRIAENLCDLCGLCTEACPAQALAFDSQEMTAGQVVEELLKDEIFYGTAGGVTLSGGDPFGQSGFTLEILRKCKSLGLHTAVETCLYVDRKKLEEFLPYIDLLIADFKVFDSELHRGFTSKDNKVILDNIIFLFQNLPEQNKPDILIRIPLIPGYTATEENLKAIARFFYSLSPQTNMELINYNPLARNKYILMGREFPCGKENEMYSVEEMEAFRGILAAEGILNIIRD